MEIAFFIMALIILVSGIGVIVSHNPIHSALWLVANLLTVAGLFANLDAHFLAVAQMIVYAGAIMVLVLFVLMLLNLKTERPSSASVMAKVVAAGFGIAFLWMIVPLLNRSFEVFEGPAVGVQGTVKEIGKLLYTKHIFPFEFASILIMAAIVGAVMLSKKKYRQ